MTDRVGTATRERILRTAEECLDRCGSENVTLLDVASAANLSRPTVYRYFASREHLVATVLADKLAKLVDSYCADLDRRLIYAEVVVDAFVHVTAAVERDELIAEALGPRRRFEVDEVTGVPAAPDTLRTLWAHVLSLGIQSGRARPGLDRTRAAHWLTDVQLNLLDRVHSGALAERDVPRLVRFFVLPGLLSAD